MTNAQRPRLIVCITCRAGRELADGETPPGALLHAALSRLLAPSSDDAAVELREVACMANCERGCSAAITMPGKWTYLLGHLAPGLAADLLAYAAHLRRLGHRHGDAVAPPGLAGEGGDRPRPAVGVRRMSTSIAKIPATIVTGFLGAGKTTLVRHVLANAGGRRIAIIVNEFGALGIDGETLRSCGIAGCAEEDIVELANGCLCCTVADDFLPTMEALLDRAQPARAHPDRDLRPGAAEAAAEGVRLAGRSARA